VDAHLKPLSVKGSVFPLNGDIRAELMVYESPLTAGEPIYKRLNSVLQNGVTNDEIRTVGMQPTPVVGGGWDFTLGVSFDSSTKMGTAFYYPINQSSQLVILTNLNMGGWTNMQIALYGLSEYWAVSPGENWLDNFKVYGTDNSSPNAAMVKAVRPSFSNLVLGHGYQLQVSGDLNNWTNQGGAFTATNTSMIYPQYWDVDDWGKLLFRLQVLP